MHMILFARWIEHIETRACSLLTAATVWQLHPRFDAEFACAVGKKTLDGKRILQSEMISIEMRASKLLHDHHEDILYI